MSQVKKPIDWQELLKLTNNKPALAKELLLMLAAELPSLRTDINDAFEHHDYPLLQDHVHKLHGSCCYTGGLQLKHTTAILEDTLKNNNHGAVGNLIKQLNLEIDLILTSIEKNTYINE